MKLGVQDASISYEVAENKKGKKKFIRRTYTGQSTSSEKSSHTTPPQKSHKGINRPPKIAIGTNTGGANQRSPKSVVRFKSNPVKVSPATPPSSKRRPKSPLQNSHRSSQGPESAIHTRPVTPNRQVKTYGEDPRFPVTSFRQEYQSITPIPTITRVRKELVFEDVAIPWNRSCNPPNRQALLVEELMKKNLRDQKSCIAHNVGARPRSAPAGHKKTLPESYARNRNSKTNGAILNLPYAELRRNAPKVERNIHEKRWNIQTKDRDDDERARPENGKDTSLHAMYSKENAYYRRNRPVTGGAINRTHEYSQEFR